MTSVIRSAADRSIKALQGTSQTIVAQDLHKNLSRRTELGRHGSGSQSVSQAGRGAGRTALGTSLSSKSSSSSGLFQLDLVARSPQFESLRVKAEERVLRIVSLRRETFSCLRTRLMPKHGRLVFGRAHRRTHTGRFSWCHPCDSHRRVPGVRTWSPTVLLTRLEQAYLPSSDGIGSSVVATVLHDGGALCSICATTVRVQQH